MPACLFAAVLFPATICMSVRARWIVAETAACTLHKKNCRQILGGGWQGISVGLLKHRCRQVDRFMTVEAYNKITGKTPTGLFSVYKVRTSVGE